MQYKLRVVTIDDCNGLVQIQIDIKTQILMEGLVKYKKIKTQMLMGGLVKIQILKDGLVPIKLKLKYKYRRKV